VLTAPVRDLLIAAAQGEVGLDHRFLQALLGRFDDATPELVKFGLEERDDPVSLEPLLIDLFRFSPSAEALPLLIDLVRRDPAEIADELVEAFCRLGEASIGPLLDLYKELGPERGSEVAFVLAALQSPDPRIQQLIEERPALGDDGFLLEVYGNRGATLEPYDIWSDYPDEAGPRFDVMSQDRLFHLAQNSADPEVRGRSWAHLESEQARSVMLSRLQDPSVPVVERSGALIGLASGEGDALVRPHILEFYQIPEARVQALEAMRRTLDPGFGIYFSRHLDDPDLETRRAAILGAGYLRMHSQLRRIEKYFFDEELRLDALYAYALAAPGKVSALHARRTLVKIDKLADGLSAEEAELVEAALDDLLVLHGLAPVFSPEEAAAPEPPAAAKHV